MARRLAVELRLRIRQGRHAAAIERLKAGLTLARRTGNGATLIEGIVRLALANLRFDRVAGLVAQPGAPNRYWALSDLPPTFLNLWQATRRERGFHGTGLQRKAAKVRRRRGSEAAANRLRDALCGSGDKRLRLRSLKLDGTLTML